MLGALGQGGDPMTTQEKIALFVEKLDSLGCEACTSSRQTASRLSMNGEDVESCDGECPTVSMETVARTIRELELPTIEPSEEALAAGVAAAHDEVGLGVGDIQIQRAAWLAIVAAMGEG
jgi:hypothetical protein